MGGRLNQPSSPAGNITRNLCLCVRGEPSHQTTEPQCSSDATRRQSAKGRIDRHSFSTNFTTIGGQPHSDSRIFDLEPCDSPSQVTARALVSLPPIATVSGPCGCEGSTADQDCTVRFAVGHNSGGFSDQFMLD